MSDEYLAMKMGRMGPMCLMRPIGPIVSLFLESLRRDELDQIADSTRVTPLVVVPGKDFDHASADYLRVLGVDDG